MNLQKLPIGTMIISNNTRLIIVGYNQNQPNNYLVVVCNDKEIVTNKVYTLPNEQIEKVISLGYVDINTNQTVNTNNQEQTTSKGKFIFDENGFVIGEN